MKSWTNFANNTEYRIVYLIGYIVWMSRCVVTRKTRRRERRRALLISTLKYLIQTDPTCWYLCFRVDIITCAIHSFIYWDELPQGTHRRYDWSPTGYTCKDYASKDLLLLRLLSPHAPSNTIPHLASTPTFTQKMQFKLKDERAADKPENSRVVQLQFYNLEEEAERTQGLLDLKQVGAECTNLGIQARQR